MNSWLKFYKEYSKTKEYISKEQEAIQKVRDYGGNSACMFSGGKDSTVLLDILCKHYKPVLYIHHYKFNYDLMPPEYSKKLLKNMYVIMEQKADAHKSIYTSRNDTAADFFMAINKFTKKFNIKTIFSSLRSEESIKRKNLLRKEDIKFQNCRNIPILKDFMVRDIWAYIAKHRVPYLDEWYDRPDKRFASFNPKRKWERGGDWWGWTKGFWGCQSGREN